MKKKIYTLLFAIVAGISTMLADAVQIGELYYNLNDENNEATVTNPPSVYDERVSYTMTTVDIPESINYNERIYSVTSIGNRAFYGCSNITDVTIPYGVTEIGGCAFQGCTSLISITIPNSVTIIRWWAFVGCESLTSLNIPGSVTHLDVVEGFADGSTNLTAINVAEDNPVYCSIDGNVYSKDKTKFVLVAPGKQGTFNVPNHVTEIGEGSFHGCMLTNIMIPEGVTTIGSFAFEHCSNLTSLEIPNSVVNVGNGIFGSCYSLTTLTIGENATSIGGSFYGCRNLIAIYNHSTTPQDLEYGRTEEEPGVFVCKVYVPKESIPLYRVANGWRDFAYIEAIEDAQGIEDVQSNRTQSTKFIKNGQVLIDKNGKTYNIIGAEVK